MVGKTNGMSAGQRPRMIAGLCIRLVLALGMAGCSAEPRNGQAVVDPGHVNFSGYVPWASDPSTGQAGTTVYFDRSVDGVSWDSGGSFKAETTPYLDSAGRSWYKYESFWNLGVPGEWSGSLSSHTATIKLRTYVRGSKHKAGVSVFDPSTDTGLATFEQAQATANCVQTNMATGFADVINKCDRKTATQTTDPVVTISTTCGKVGTMCCGKGNACDPGMGCQAYMNGDLCGACGANGQPPCRTATGGRACNSAGSGPVNQICTPCGGVGQSVCDTTPACHDGAVRRTGSAVCEACGGLNQLACNLDRAAPLYCNAGLEVDFDTAVCKRVGGSASVPPAPAPPKNVPPACGTANNFCCAGNSCNAGLYCSAGFCGPNPPDRCDYYGESCCPGEGLAEGSCNTTVDRDLVCRSGYCVYR